MAQIKDLKTGIKYKDTPIGKIPVDWEVVRLEDVCDEIYRYPTYYNIKYVEQDGVPEVRGELIKNNGELSSDPSEYRYISKETSANFPRTILHEGDFVLSVRGTMGKIGYIPSNLENANMTANLMRISPNRNKVYPLWLKQFFLSDFFQNSLDQASSATTIKTIKAPELKAIDLALPSLSEQNKIAEILTTVDETIEKTDQIIEKTKEVKKGLIQKLLTSGIGHTKFIKTEIGEIPIEWEVGTFSKIADVNPKRDLQKGTIYPFVEMAAIDSESHKVQFSKPRRYEGGGTRFQNGDTLFARITPCTENGKTAYVDFLKENKFGHGSTEFIVLGPKENVDPKFIYYSAKWEKVRNIAVSKMEGTSGRQRVPVRVFLEDISIAIPPLFEQKRISEILSSFDEEIEKESNRKGQLETLKKGLMQVLLIGKIRVSV